MQDKDNSTGPGTAPTYEPEVSGTEPERLARDTATEQKEVDAQVEAFADAQTEAAVDDIVARDSDALLQAEDEKRVKPVPTKRGFKGRIAALLKSRRFWLFTVLGIVLLSGVLGAIPPTRYFLLNTAGVRSGASVLVRDEVTRQPLKNVAVSVADQTAETDEEGIARFTGLRLGDTTLKLERRGFAPKEQPVTLGWGSNPLGELALQAVGIQYTFVVEDFLTGNAVEKAEAFTGGDASAFSDVNGKIILIVDQDDESTQASIEADGYRTEKVTLPEDNETELNIKLVPARKHAFVSKRSGKYDVYKIDVDGKNEELVLSGTGNESDSIALVPHPTAEVAVLVSTRSDTRNSKGQLLNTLTLIDLNDNSTTEVTQAEYIQVVGWAGDRLVYIRTETDKASDAKDRARLVSYDYSTEDTKDLATANYFNDAVVVQGAVYYTPSGTSDEQGFFKVQPDATNKQQLLAKEVWNMVRTGYDTIDLSSSDQWYRYSIKDTTVGEIAAPASVPDSRTYIDSPNGKHSLWIDRRDGKGVLLAYDTEHDKDTVLQTQSGLTNPVRWISDTVAVYRVSTQVETADYVMSTKGGEALKIRDVTDTSGIDRWYYY